MMELDPHAADRALVEACVTAERRARAELVRRYHRAVRQSIGFLSSARSGRVSAADVEDAVQQTFLIIFKDDAAVLQRWAGRSSLRTYLRRIAERVGVRHFQRLLTRHGRFRLDLDAPAESGPRVERIEDEALAAPERMMADEARAAARQRVIDQLSEKGRQYYDYLFVQELDVATIARREETTANNVYQWKNRIARIAREVIDEWLNAQKTAEK